MVNSFIVWYLFLTGVGGGAFLIAAVVDVLLRFRSDSCLVKLEPVTEGGLYLGPAAVLLGAVFLLADLGSPDRAFQVFFTSSSSLLTLGSWFVALFCGCSLVSLIAGSLVYVSFMRVVEVASHVLATVFSFCSILYSGLYLSLFSTVPFLHTFLIPILFIVSALSTGMAVLLVFGFVMQDKDGVLLGVSGCVRLDIALLVLECLLLILVLWSACMRGDEVARSAVALVVGEYAGLFWFGVVSVGLLIPIVAAVLHLGSSSPLAFLVGAGCSLVGGLCLRYALLLAAVRFSVIDMSPVAFWG